jgi:hypothetical protein
MRLRPASFSREQEAFIIEHASEYTTKELAERFELTIGVVYGIGYRHKLTFKAKNQRVKESPPIRERKPVPAGLLPDPAPANFERPAAIYDNHGFINTSKKYS